MIGLTDQEISCNQRVAIGSWDVTSNQLGHIRVGWSWGKCFRGAAFFHNLAPLAVSVVVALCLDFSNFLLDRSQKDDDDVCQVISTLRFRRLYAEGDVP